MKTGILTFHKVYNYGAVLQAYSTQQIMNRLGFDNEIIDFSPKTQKDLTSAYSFRNGFKRMFKSLLLLNLDKKRRSRIDKFDCFIEDRLKKSNEEFVNESDLKRLNDEYDVFLVGSDQVWNVTKKAEKSKAYFLDFVCDDKAKISYASSIGSAGIEDLRPMTKYLKRFNAVSCREQGGADVLSDLIEEKVPSVLDPTMLVELEDFKKIEKKYDGIDITEDYLLFYSVKGFDSRNENILFLKELSKKMNLQLLCICPEWPKQKYGINLVDVGPEEFLYLIHHAKLVCTNSFHGTAISIRYNRPFFVLENGNKVDDRKQSLLDTLSLANRVLYIKDNKCLFNIEKKDINYNEANRVLKIAQEKSFNYLKDSFSFVKE